MNPASRTPEGEPNQCPICGHEVRLEPSRPPGDAPCPYCGHLLWFGLSKNPAAFSLSQATDVFKAWTQQVAQVPDDRYFEELVLGLVKFMAARGGAVWMPTNKGAKLKCCHGDVEFTATPSDQEGHCHLLRQVAANGRASVGRSPASAGTEGTLLLAVPVKQEQGVKAIIEIVQYPGASWEVQQRNLRYLELICEFAHDRICELADVGPSLETAVADAASEVIVKKRWWEMWKK
jgi:hypothetical protein